jgi:cellulose synthase/poly-beta-1,6-N-acetylglucosamine synthase-like glycosyltransferase
MAQKTYHRISKDEWYAPPLPASGQHGVSDAGLVPQLANGRRINRLDEGHSSRPPLVSCIMPSFNRRRFVPRAIMYFLRQDYPNKELVLVDDGTDPIGDLIPADPRLHYIQIPQRASRGAKRNLACEQASGGTDCTLG